MKGRKKKKTKRSFGFTPMSVGWKKGDMIYIQPQDKRRKPVAHEVVLVSTGSKQKKRR
jgi:hypothetical protein